jgi:hypothetical protein
MAVTNVGISDDPEDQQMILNVLTNTLYTDKVSAVLREYGCNAADANVEAGRGDQPIEVRLPNRLDATVSIRDFGFGMSQDQIVKVFCRLGRSTKRNSNAFTGMLGIGSKAGFAYGDHFVVVSYSGGKKTIYNLYRDQGNLQCAKMHEAASDDPDGVEIKVPVKTVDMNEFTAKAERVFRYFKVRPKITGANIVWNDRAQQYAGTGWRFTGSGADTSVAIMGNVGYSLNSAGMGFASYSADKYDSLLGLGVELDFEIGDLEIAANREGLQYRDATKTAIKAKLDVIVAEMSKVFSGKIAGAKSLWEAKILYHETFEKLDHYSRHSLKNVVSGTVNWNNVSLTSSEFNVENRSPKDPEINVLHVTKTYNSSLRNHPDPWSIHARESVTLVINDLPTKRHSPSRMKGWFSTNSTCKEIVVFTFHTAQAEKKFLKAKHLKGAPMTLLSTITPLVSVSNGGTTSAHNSKHSAKVFFLNEQYNTGRGYARSLWWSTDNVDYKDGAGVYVTIDGFRIIGTGDGQEPWDFLKDVIRIRDAGLITTPVYGFKPDRAAKVGKKWIKLEDSIRAKLDAIIKAGYGQEFQDFVAVTNYDCLFEGVSKLPAFPKGCAAEILVREITRMKNAKAKYLPMFKLANVGVKPWLEMPALPPPSVDLKKLEANVLKEWPLLAAFGKKNIQELRDLTEIVNYAKLVAK